jgi:hypothetical protein
MFPGLMLDTAEHPLSFHSVAAIVLPPTELALVNFDSLVRTDELLRAAMHVVEH